MTAKLSTGYCLLLLEAIEWFMPLPTDFCQGDGIFYAYEIIAKIVYIIILIVDEIKGGSRNV